MGKASAINSINEGTAENKRTFAYVKEHLSELIEAAEDISLDDLKLLLDGYKSPYKRPSEREAVLVGVFLAVTRMAQQEEYAERLLSKDLARKALPTAGLPYSAVKYNTMRMPLTTFAKGYNLGIPSWLRDGARDLMAALLTAPL